VLPALLLVLLVLKMIGVQKDSVSDASSTIQSPRGGGLDKVTNW
jgi:hypothetical protein